MYRSLTDIVAESLARGPVTRDLRDAIADGTNRRWILDRAAKAEDDFAREAEYHQADADYLAREGEYSPHHAERLAAAARICRRRISRGIEDARGHPDGDAAATFRRVLGID